MNKIKIMISLIVTAIVIQFIPYGKNHTNPKPTGFVKWDSPRTKQLFNRACVDCHSFNTKWPKYTSTIAPVSWLVYNDVQEGRTHFNVSTWGQQRKNRGKDAAKAITQGEMPMFIYTMMHKNARLSDKETKDLVAGLKATFNK